MKTLSSGLRRLFLALISLLVTGMKARLQGLTTALLRDEDGSTETCAAVGILGI
jgi:hypothetical protein